MKETKEINASLGNSGLRPKRSFESQVEYLKNEKGILFNIVDEDYAKLFLQNNNYLFKLKSYAKNYSVNKEGKYVNLEFAYLIELSIIDMLLREKIIKLSLNIEHYLKLQLLRDITLNPNEDGYSIVNNYIEHINPNITKKIDNKSKSSYSNELIKKRDGHYAIWDFIEIISFGDFVELYTYYYADNHCSTKSMVNNLKSVQWLRNAAAHNNCIINHLSSEHQIDNINREVCDFISKNIDVSQRTRNKKMSNKPIHDFVVLLYVFNNIVTSEGVKQKTMEEIKDLFENRMIVNKLYFANNYLLESSYKFVKKVVDYYI